MHPISFIDGEWTNVPAHVAATADTLRVTAVEGSDAWRHTSYGFVHDTEHALLAPFEDGTAMELDFLADFTDQFDQAGLFVKASDSQWIKTGVEYTDGQLHVGAVVTNHSSDWSLAPVPHWSGRSIRVRVSRSGNALTVRAGLADEPLHLVRVAPLPAAALIQAGPFVCAPTRQGLTVSFTRWVQGAADTDLHP